MLVEIADLVDQFDVDCEYDGSETGCRAVAAAFAEDLDEEEIPQYGEGFDERWGWEDTEDDTEDSE